MADYIPKADAAFDTWQTNYVTSLDASDTIELFDAIRHDSARPAMAIDTGQ